jgi:Tfp pilus assembly protein PilZ
VDVVIEAEGAQVAATATTLGAGGLFVVTSAPLRIHEPISVRFRLPGDDTELCLPGRVAWTTRVPGAGFGTAGIGVAFDDAGARADLAAHLERWADRREDSEASGTGGL